MADLVTKTDLASGVRYLRQEIDAQTLKLTVRLGALLTAGVAILAAVMRLT